MNEVQEEESDDELYFEVEARFTETYFAKEMLNGCTSLLDMAQRLAIEAQRLEQLHREGWVLEDESLSDGYGTLVPPNIADLVAEAIRRVRSGVPDREQTA